MLHDKYEVKRTIIVLANFFRKFLFELPSKIHPFHHPICVFVYLADILSAFCIPMGCEGTLIDLPFI